MKQEAIDWWKTLPDDEKQLLVDLYFYNESRKHTSVNATEVYTMFRHFEFEEEFE